MLFVRSSIMLILCLVFSAGCEREKKEIKNEGVKKEIKAIEPFLVPAVENVSGGEDLTGDKAVLRDLIVTYNKNIVAAQIYLDDVAGLAELTTKSEFTRMYAYIQKDREDGKIMSCTLRNLKFTGISLEADTGTVKTMEDWFIEDRDLKTGKAAAQFKDIEYNVEYAVVKKKGKWLVDRVELKRVGEFTPPRANPKRVPVKTDFEKEVNLDGKNN